MRNVNVFLTGALILMAGFSLFLTVQKYSLHGQPTLPPLVGIYFPVTDPIRLAARDAAVHAWEVALHRHIETPEMFWGYSADPDDMAWVVGSRYRIYNSLSWRENYPHALQTVYMHEIGHLLGVPHIEDDPLMNPEMTVMLAKPSPFAIALAQICLRRKPASIHLTIRPSP